jgi:hypothetical protein
MNDESPPNDHELDIDAKLTSESTCKRLRVALQSRTTTHKMTFAPRLEVHAEARYSKSQIELLRKRASSRRGEPTDEPSAHEQRSFEKPRKKSQCGNCMSLEHIASNKRCPRYKQPKLTAVQKQHVLRGEAPLVVAPVHTPNEISPQSQSSLLSSSQQSPQLVSSPSVLEAYISLAMQAVSLSRSSSNSRSTQRHGVQERRGNQLP